MDKKYVQVSSRVLLGSLCLFLTCGLGMAQMPPTMASVPAYATSVPVQEPGQGPMVSAPAPVEEVISPEMLPEMNVMPEAGYMPGGYMPAGYMPAGPAQEYVETELPPCGGLFLYQYNQSERARAGSIFFGEGSFFLEGYLDQGLSYSNNDSEFYEPVVSNDHEGYSMNQLYVSMGRKVDKGCGWSFGGRVDLNYGTDYYYTSATGLETSPTNVPHWNGTDDDTPEYRATRNRYGLSLPQAYGEVYAPIFQGVDVKVGHFNSVMGFESPQAPMNFFYSRSYSGVYGMPTTMTGVMTTSRVGLSSNLILGAVNEWNAFDTEHDKFSFVGGLTYENQCTGNAFGAIVMTGDQYAPAFQQETYSEEAANTTVVNLFAKFQLSPRLTYVCEFVAGFDDRTYYCIETQEDKNGRSWYGLSNYLFLRTSDTLAWGFRFEWFRDSESTIINGGYAQSFCEGASDVFSWTFGANWEPTSWLVFRPEVRWDYCDWEDSADSNFRTFDENTAHSQFTFGADMIVRF